VDANADGPPNRNVGLTSAVDHVSRYPERMSVSDRMSVPDKKDEYELEQLNIMQHLK
jgi:hypothetical protein